MATKLEKKTSEIVNDLRALYDLPVEKKSQSTFDLVRIKITTLKTKLLSFLSSNHTHEKATVKSSANVELGDLSYVYSFGSLQPSKGRFLYHEDELVDQHGDFKIASNKTDKNKQSAPASSIEQSAHTVPSKILGKFEVNLN